ncbi:MAG: hypothetical protein E7813_17075 [Bradyrhizobium sp.]|uniref:hypothetical protein n=1 Tax=Bradyrhizobium sp. TaxID=376 RepID=UPI0012265DA3|nr:hypothetical protein [Bradyrhizobium sp.]THD64255.1 MAG: hypothetical protein E7813_17075 [Bradyrhizobium sp.]
MLKYLSKFALDILPSVVATIIGAYIVNHYIVTKPGTASPVAAAVSTAEPKADAKAEVKVAPETAKADASTDVANIPEPGVRAKGISEKVIFQKSAVEKPVEKSTEKPAEKPAETASIPADTKRHPAALREKAVAKAVPAPVPAVAPVAPNPAPPVEATIAPDAQPRDASDLARAAIERLRANDGAPRPLETARLPDLPHVPDAPRIPDPPRIVSAPPVQPLPPPIMVSTPPSESFDSTTGSVRVDDPRRPTPPADIPSSRPLDLHAEAAKPPPRPRSNVAEDVLLAAKSVLHKVLPNSSAN